MTDLTPRLPELRKVTEAATPGPWLSELGLIWGDYPRAGFPVADTRGHDKYHRPALPGERDANAAHIAAFDPPTAIALLDEIDRQAQEIARLKEGLRPFAEYAERLEPREAGGWHRVNKFGGKDVVMDVTFTDLEPFIRARLLTQDTPDDR